MSRKSIPLPIRQRVWVQAAGKNFTSTCECCYKNKITVFDYHTAHIVSDKDGGDMKVDNLLAVCRACNLSMGKENLRAFQSRCGFKESHPWLKWVWKKLTR
jgi:5-methylcytosine-specific restriction endonuclease McrA